MKKTAAPWTKRCDAPLCTLFVPDNHDLCDHCLLSRYDLTGEYDTMDYEGIGPRLYDEDEVLKALRLARSGS